ncbi:MAG: copper homeostasis protein CutC [Bacteroidetes bacterium]|nr:MAG: copper homeostasis protein CutC [Bacteroidota bacterium]
MPSLPILEACVDSPARAIGAQKNGADRIELCADLAVGGLTPPVGLVEAVVSVLRIPVMAMVRPRAGNFCYSETELDQMCDTIVRWKKAGVAGVVFGILTPKKEIHLEKVIRLARLAAPLEVTFHKAIDECPDPVAAARSLAQTGVITRILTSGGAPSALEGAPVIRRMMAATGGKTEILPGGKITRQNLPEVHARIGAQAYHGRKIVGDLDHL